MKTGGGESEQQMEKKNSFESTTQSFVYFMTFLKQLLLLLYKATMSPFFNVNSG